MGPGGRAFAGAVLGLLFLGLIGVIGLQAVPPPPTPTPAPVASSTAATPAAAPSAAANTGGANTTINATEKDYSIAIDQSSVPAGNITFKITNQGATPHNVGVTKQGDASKGSGITGPVIKDSDNVDVGKTGSVTMNLPPGTYNVVCTIAGHVQLGMIVTLTVK